MRVHLGSGRTATPDGFSIGGRSRIKTRIEPIGDGVVESLPRGTGANCAPQGAGTSSVSDAPSAATRRRSGPSHPRRCGARPTRTPPRPRPALRFVGPPLPARRPGRPDRRDRPPSRSARRPGHDDGGRDRASPAAGRTPAPGATRVNGRGLTRPSSDGAAATAQYPRPDTISISALLPAAGAIARCAVPTDTSYLAAICLTAGSALAPRALPMSIAYAQRGGDPHVRRLRVVDERGSSAMTGRAGIREPRLPAARWSDSATKAAYTRSVVVPPPLCPSRPATVRTSTPAAISSVAE